jgi:hypothetical protein
MSPAALTRASFESRGSEVQDVGRDDFLKEW